MLTASELASALRTSERQIQRHTSSGMPFQPIGARGKRYILAECQQWLKEAFGCRSKDSNQARGTLLSASTASEYTAASRRQQLRVMPSNSKPI